MSPSSGGVAGGKSTPATEASCKTVELRVPGFERTAAVTGSSRDRSVVGAIEFASGSYERHLMERILEILEPDSVSIDLGANIGAITIAMAWASPRGHVYSFEASPTSYRHLLHNLRQNQLDHVTPVNLAVFDDELEMEFSYVEEVSGCSFLSTKGVREGRTERVASVALDQWLAAQGLAGRPPLRLIKLDVEGAELHGLRGALRTLREHRPHLLVEFNPDPIERFFHDDPRDLVELLMEIFPSVDVIDRRDGSLHPVRSYEALRERAEAGDGWEDLHCRF
jgi:FkbM family methyltransferase